MPGARKPTKPAGPGPHEPDEPREPALLHGSSPPGETDLAAVLGRAKRHWDALLAGAIRANTGAAATWKRYAGKTGWRLILRHRARNLCYLKPMTGRFLLSLALSEAALDAAEDAGIPQRIIGPIRASPRLPEGRAARIEVASAADAAIAAKLISLKAAKSAR